MSKKAMSYALALSSVLLFSSYASAALCKNPTVHIWNDSSETIVVTSFQYFDECDGRWRTENVAATAIVPNGSHSFDDDLEYVESCDISAFNVRHQHPGDPFVWSGSITPEQGTTVACDANAHYDVRLH